MSLLLSATRPLEFFGIMSVDPVESNPAASMRGRVLAANAPQLVHSAEHVRSSWSLLLCLSECCLRRLFSSAHFNDTFLEHTPPEILNSSLDTVVLTMKALGIDKVRHLSCEADVSAELGKLAGASAYHRPVYGLPVLPQHCEG